MNKFSNVFIESLIDIDEQKRISYLTSTFQLPKKVSSVFYAPETSAFISGLIKTHDVPTDMINKIAFAIVQIFIGEKTLAQLPAILSTELKISNDKAQKMAAEIEKDIFGPVRGELDEFLSGKAATQPRDTAVRNSLQNVLNLKELPPKQPQASLPPRPVQKDLPVRPPQSPLLTKERPGEVRKPRTPLPPPHDFAQGKPPTPPRAGGGNGPIIFT